MSNESQERRTVPYRTVPYQTSGQCPTTSSGDCFQVL